MLFGLPPIHADYNDYTSRAALVQGYNTNVYQSVDASDPALAHRNPSLFTGVDGMVQVRVNGRDADKHDFRLGGRAQHYYAKNQEDDGSVYGAWFSKFAVSPRTNMILGAAATVTSLNSSHISDGTLFLIDPTTLRRTYWITTTDATVIRELAPTWTLYQRFGIITSGTLEQAPVVIGTASVSVPPGLNYVVPESETTLAKKFTPRATGELRLLLKDTYSAFTVDISKADLPLLPPEHFLTGTIQAAHVYEITPRVVNRVYAGGTVASPPPQDADKKLVIAPSFGDSLFYTRETWYAAMTAGYQYGTLSPRIGAGPSATVQAVLVGIPYPVGHWRNLGLLSALAGGRSIISAGSGPSTTYDTATASAQVRYALNTWLGITAGYDFRYALLDRPAAVGAVPSLPLIRHIMFLGVSGYWSTDPTEPPLNTFQAPVTPPG